MILFYTFDGENASVVVKSDGLSASQAAEIKDILLSETSVENENIRIFEVKELNFFSECAILYDV